MKNGGRIMAKTLRIGFVAAAALAFFFAIGAATDLQAQPRPTASADNKVDWKTLFETCSSNFSRYETELAGVKSVIQNDLTKMSQDKYVELMVKDDPRIVFASAIWPEITKEKNELWDSYEECAAMHTKTVKTLGSQTAASKTKKRSVEELKNCLYADLEHDRLAPPLDTMIACYEKAAK